MIQTSETKAIQAIAVLVDFIKTKTKNNIFEYSKNLNLDKDELQRLVNIIDASISQAFTTAIDTTVATMKSD